MDNKSPGSTIARRTGKYSLISIVQTPRIDPGDTIEVDLYVLGGGHIGDNRLDIIYGFQHLINADGQGQAESAVGIDLDGNIRTGQETIDDELIKTRYELPATGRQFSFASELINTHGHESETDFPPSELGRSHDGNPPLRLEIKTGAEASPGNYELPLVFTYGSGEIIKQDRTHVGVHVNSWVERHRYASTIAIIASAVIALLSLIATSGILSSVSVPL